MSNKQDVIHITPVLAKLHWLPVKARVAFKLATLVYNIHRTSSQSYLASLFFDYKPVRNLRSPVKHPLEATAPRLKTLVRAFHHAAVAKFGILFLRCSENAEQSEHSNSFESTSVTTAPTKVPELLPTRLRMADPHTAVVDITSYLLY